MPSPPGRRRRVHPAPHSDLPDLNHNASLGGMSTSTPSPRKQRSKKRRRGGNKLYFFFSALCGIVIIPLCYVKLAYYMVYAGSDVPLKNGITAEYDLPKNIRGSGRTDNTQQASPDTNDETHQIPRILLFTHYRDLLNTPLEELADDEEKTLATNVHHSINIHQQHDRKNGFQKDGRLLDVEPILDGPTRIRFLTDKDCLDSLQKVYPSLIPFFLNETQGMFKADICRGAALYETGGIYLDVDVGVRADLWYDLLTETEFFTSLVHRQSKYPKHFFQAILGAAPKSRIIYKYLELFMDHYTHKDYVDGGPLGVILLRRAWDAVYDPQSDNPATELYQEVLYNPKGFPDLYPPPTWGTRRACHFVVVARAHKEETVEFTIQPQSSSNQTDTRVRKYRIPLYSRIGGSRMCPIKGAEKSS